MFYSFSISFLFLSSFYYYNKNFKNFDDLSSCFFKKILYYLDFKCDLIDIRELPSKLIIIGSHTSIYDFFIGTIFYYAYLHEKYDTYVLMKKQFEKICNPLLYFFDSRFKLISVDKTNKNDENKTSVTKQICNTLLNKDNYIIFIAPEGTRKCTDKLRSGYWYISKELDTDILYLGIDFLKKEIVMEHFRKPKDTWEEEQEEFIKSCKKYIPLYPERCFWIKDYYHYRYK